MQVCANFLTITRPTRSRSRFVRVSFRQQPITPPIHRSPILRSGVFCIPRKREEGRRKKEEELLICRVREGDKSLSPDPETMTHAPPQRLNHTHASANDIKQCSQYLPVDRCWLNSLVKSYIKICTLNSTIIK